MSTLVIVSSEAHERAAKDAGATNVAVVDPLRGGEQILAYRPSASEYDLGIGYDNPEYVLALPAQCADLRDQLAVRLGDEKCKWVDWPFHGDVTHALGSARPMWTDELARLSDIPDPGEVRSYRSGFPALDDHGFRFELPAFMSLIGPYGSGKSVLLRQLLVNLACSTGGAASCPVLRRR